MDTIHAVLTRLGATPDALPGIADIVRATGRLFPQTTPVDVEVLESQDGQQIAYVQAGDVEIFVSPEPGAGVHCDFHTRNDRSRELLQLAIDGRPVSETHQTFASPAACTDSPRESSRTGR
ncbi:hypothetical protein ACQPYK_49535 (plasmid) [Streptosporangium sp. CA-135522]|uniref:hypothetical protein n=1 Tax=Streptosporangium sp. CA-135522 TaxID=3240072 RepID=UPI003D8AA995